MKTKRMMRVLSLLAALAMFTALLSGCGGTPAEVSIAMSEEEYVDTIGQVMQDYASSLQDLAEIDTTDLDAAKDALNATKAPFDTFLQVEAPEKYAEADAKFKDGCRGWNEYIDITVSLLGETDQDKLAASSTKLVELAQTIQADFQEAAQLMSSADAG